MSFLFPLGGGGGSVAAPSSPSSQGTVAVATIINNALDGHNVYGPGEQRSPANSVYCLSQLNQIIDDWNADGQSSIAEVFSTFATTPSQQPHTVGPTGTWVLPVRPVRIDGAAVEMSSGSWTQIDVHHDPGWWLAQSLLVNASVTDLYYAATVPNGEIYFSGIPTSALNVKLMTRTTLATVLLTQTLALAPGYESALTLTLQEAIADAFHATISPKLEKRAGIARGRIFANNLRIPSLSTAGLGIPGSGGGRWDYLTGRIR